MAERQELKATVTLPKGLTEEQTRSLKEKITADLIGTLGGSEYLREQGITVVVDEEIFSPVSLVSRKRPKTS